MSQTSTATISTSQSDPPSSIPQSDAPKWTVETKREKNQTTATVPDTVHLTGITIRQMNEPDRRGRRYSLIASDGKTANRYVWSGDAEDLRNFASLDDRDYPGTRLFKQAVRTAGLDKDNDGIKQEYTTTEGEKGKYWKEKDEGTGEDLYVYSYKAPMNGTNIRELEEISILSKSLMEERAKFDVTASEVWARFQGDDLESLKAAGSFKTDKHDYSWRTTSVKDDKGKFTYHIKFKHACETEAKETWETMGGIEKGIEANSTSDRKYGIDWEALKKSITQHTSRNSLSPQAKSTGTDPTVV